MIAKNTICLWFDKDAEAAARFYAATFPNSEVRAVHKAPGDFPGGKQGDVLTVDFTVCGDCNSIRCTCGTCSCASSSRRRKAA